MSERHVPDSEKILVDLVKADYDATHRALTGFVSSAGQLRAVGIAVWGVLYAAALAARSVEVAVVAVLVLPAFVVADGYYSALYRQTLHRSREIEGLLGGYHNAIGIHRGDERRLIRAVATLEQHEFGVHRSMKPVNQDRWWWWPRPLRVAAVYPLMLAVGVVTAVILGLTDHGQANCSSGRDGQPPCVVLTAPGPVPAVTVTT
ncbi:MAG: hypothetical protein ABR569_11620, partial [Gaiellaceae bacterium]